MRGFQIWSQNWNWIKFDPIFGPKTVENRKNVIFCQFLTVFFCQNGVKCYPISIQFNGVIETFCKYLQSIRRKYWLADWSTLRAWHLQVRQFWDKIRRILPFASFVYRFHWITPKLWEKTLIIPLNKFLEEFGRAGGNDQSSKIIPTDFPSHQM